METSKIDLKKISYGYGSGNTPVFRHPAAPTGAFIFCQSQPKKLKILQVSDGR
jgi:hypothetical protein